MSVQRLFKAIKDFCLAKPLFCLFLASFFLWLFSFRGFLRDELNITSDAFAYYDHIRFFLDQISRLVYPMWDPTRNWGVPIEFFMRRIGSFNPLFFFVLILNKIGIPYYQSYLVFLSSYYFLGMFGFYLLAKRIFRSQEIAFSAFLLLTFSSLGTRVFDSYILFTFIPMTWFFFFLVAFSQEQERRFFLGGIFSLMILSTTYIPFYFLLIFLFFLFFFTLFFFADLKKILSRYRQFVKNNKIFVGLCAVLLIVSLIPGILFYLEGRQAEFTLPLRHSTESATPHMLGVHTPLITKWGIMEDIVFSYFFLQDLRKIEFAVLYIPLFGYLILFLGLSLLLTRRLVFFFVWGMTILLMGTPYATSFYQFLYAHIFFFKYFRNLHFFLWFILLPIFILFVTDQFRLLLDRVPPSERKKYQHLGFIALVHIGFLIFLLWRGSTSVSSYTVLALSLGFFILQALKKIRAKGNAFLAFVFLLIVIEPLEVYSYLQDNAPRTYEGYQRLYTLPYRDIVFPSPEENTRHAVIRAHRAASLNSSDGQQRPRDVYLGSAWSHRLMANIDQDIFEYYVLFPFVAYDYVEPMDEADVDFERIERAFARSENVAFIPADSPPTAFTGNQRPRGRAEFFTSDTKDIEVLQFDVNFIKFKTHFNSRKFLVYHDSFHSEWQGFVNGQKTKIFRANIGFKGLWLEPGTNVVYFRYGAPWRYVLNFALLGIFQGVFWYLLWLGVREKKKCKLA